MKYSIAAGDYDFGGRPITETNLLLLISELEGSSQNLKYLGFGEDMEIINTMKKKYYKMYFHLKKHGSVAE